MCGPGGAVVRCSGGCVPRAVPCGRTRRGAHPRAAVALLLALASYVLVAAIVYESLEEVFGRRAAIAAAFWPLCVVFAPAVIGAVLIGRLVGHAVAEWCRGAGDSGEGRTTRRNAR